MRGQWLGPPEVRWGHVLLLLPVLRPMGPPELGREPGGLRGAAREHRPRKWAGHEDQWAQLQELVGCKMPEGAPEPMHPRTPTSRQGFGRAGSERWPQVVSCPGQVPARSLSRPCWAWWHHGHLRWEILAVHRGMFSSICHLHPPPDTPPL